MFSWPDRLLVVLMIATGIGGNWEEICADEPNRTADERGRDSTTQLVVLTDGQVFSGRLIPRTDGYDVILPNGRLFIADFRIRFLADNRQEAYRKMRETVVQRTPAAHVAMARWCLANSMPGNARRELLDALHLDPDYSTARTMLEGLAREDRRRQEAHDKSLQDVRDDVVIHRAMAVDRRSLGGLPAELARDFSVGVQSLISRNCGNSNCHGSTTNNFQFIHFRRDSSIAAAERNLASVLDFIDLTDPSASPLMVKATEIHGGLNRPLFPGRVGNTQLQILRDWVSAVAAEMGPGNKSPVKMSPVVNSTMIRAGAAGDDATSTVTAGFNKTATESSVDDNFDSSIRLRSETETRFNKLTRRAVRKDPYDPRIFNQRYHPNRSADSP